ncbi:MAG: hypothetical protein WC554_07250 [Clostridia bacterium]|jgi:hypothetical protein
MNQQTMLGMLCIIIFSIVVAIGIAIFEEQNKQDKTIIEQKSISVAIPQQPQLKVIAHYRCFDFGLPSGTVVRFSPSDDVLDALSEDEARKKDIYIHILQDNGDIRVEKCTYETWIKLCIGDILK